MVAALEVAVMPREATDDAKCRDGDPDAFWPPKGGSVDPAVRICASCPVRQQCADWALDHDERFGVWGGLSEQERTRVRRGRADPDRLWAETALRLAEEDAHREHERRQREARRPDVPPPPPPASDGWVGKVAMNVACGLLDLAPDRLLTRERDPDAAWGRQIVCWLLGEAGWTSGRVAGVVERDPSTVRVSQQRVEKRARTSHAAWWDVWSAAGQVDRRCNTRLAGAVEAIVGRAEVAS